jgi:hypothetical protein
MNKNAKTIWFAAILATVLIILLLIGRDIYLKQGYLFTV